ncbi:MAG TPA: murein transglycosylase [Pseudonocardiaceae bacterium]|nr:murein transglycosylase [Pseudonocardiaceae bacterium]
MSRVWRYGLCAAVSGGALASASLMAAVLTTVTALSPERGLAASAPVVMAEPPTLLEAPAPPDLPEPAAAPAAPSPAAPIAAPTQAVTIPAQIPASTTPGGRPQQAYFAWASRLSWVTGIPVRALQAYAYAHAVMARSRPSCQLTWTTLAGIAAVESQHGTIGGRTLLADGRPSAPIIGIALNGANGTRVIPATDGGRLTGDRIWERAVGPFQFIPSAWAIWRTDAHGDGMTDPQNIDNAALAAAKYLCANNRNLARSEDWLQAILSYNNSMDYARNVYAYAQAYARSAQAIR